MCNTSRSYCPPPFLLARPSSQAAYNRSVSDGGILAAGAASPRFFDRTSGWSSGDVGAVVSRVSVVSGGSKSSFSSLDSTTMTGVPMCKSADINAAWLWEARIEAGLR